MSIQTMTLFGYRNKGVRMFFVYVVKTKTYFRNVYDSVMAAHAAKEKFTDATIIYSLPEVLGKIEKDLKEIKDTIKELKKSENI